MNERDERSLREIVRLCDHGGGLAGRGHEWYVADELNTPGLAAESIIIKIGENVARLSDETIASHPQVPWSSIKRMRDRLAHHYEATDYDAVWATINVDLPRVRAAIALLLSEVATSDHAVSQVMAPGPTTAESRTSQRRGAPPPPARRG